MDVAHPIRAVIPTLDGPILEVLARTTRPLTGREVHRLSGVGSQSGTRLALERLVDQGVVFAEPRGRAVFYSANREHLAWPAVEDLALLRRALIQRLQDDLRTWSPGPLHASLFGSAARGDGDAHSDIDILLIRPSDVGEDDSPWADQVDLLRERVRAWTGNNCQPFQVDLERLAEHARAGDPLLAAWRRDALKIAGEDLHALLRQVLAPGDRQ